MREKSTVTSFENVQALIVWMSERNEQEMALLMAFHKIAQSTGYKVAHRSLSGQGANPFSVNYTSDRDAKAKQEKFVLSVADPKTPQALVDVLKGMVEGTDFETTFTGALEIRKAAQTPKANGKNAKAQEPKPVPAPAGK